MKTHKLAAALACTFGISLVSLTGIGQTIGKFALHRHTPTSARRVNRSRPRDASNTDKDELASIDSANSSAAPPDMHPEGRLVLPGIPDLVAAVAPLPAESSLNQPVDLTIQTDAETLPIDGPDSGNTNSAGPPLLPQPTPAQTSPKESLFSFNYVKLVGADVKEVFTSPARWETKDWLVFGGVSAGIGLTYLFDEDIRKAVQRNRNPTVEHVFDAVQPFGDQYSFGVLGAFYLGGELLHNPKAKAVGLDGLSASIIASGLITSPLKYIAGRSRPNHNQGSDHFQMFSQNLSFPSGHTTQAFAVASVIAEHYDAIWIKAASYGLASMVGYARLNNDAHWASDVLAGAAIGTFVGHVVVHFNEHHRDLNLTPLIGWHMQGVQLSWSF